MQSKITSSLTPDILFFPTHICKFATSLFLLHFTNFLENTFMLIEFLPILYPGTKILEGPKVCWYQTSSLCIVLTWRLRSSILISIPTLICYLKKRYGRIRKGSEEDNEWRYGMAFNKTEQSEKMILWKNKIRNYR